MAKYLYPSTSFWLVIASSILLASCSPVYYSPNVIHTPTVKERGDATLEGGVQASNKARGIEGRLAYSPIKHGFVMSNFMHLSGKSTTTEFDPTTGSVIERKRTGNGFLAEAGIGYYRPLSTFTTWSVAGGFGAGRSNNYFVEKYAELKFTRAFVQSGIHIRGEVADFGCSLRLSNLDFSSGRIDFSLPEEDIIQIRRIDDKDRFLMADFGLSAGYNFRPVHVKCNFTFSLYEENALHGFASNAASISMAVDLHELFGSKKKKN
jgi:hypothetical protein